MTTPARMAARITVRHLLSPVAWRADLVATVEAGLASAVAATGRRPRLALSGGATPRVYLPALVRAPLPWAAVTVSVVDDRGVPPTHPASNLGLVWRHVAIARPDRRPRLLPLGTPADRIPDVAVLGMGGDGHIASLFPDGQGMPGPSPLTLSVHRPGEPYARTSLSPDALAAVPTLVLMIAGAEKAALWQRIATAAPDTADLPVVRLLRAATGSVRVLLLDRGAVAS